VAEKKHERCKPQNSQMPIVSPEAACWFRIIYHAATEAVASRTAINVVPPPADAVEFMHVIFRAFAGPERLPPDVTEAWKLSMEYLGVVMRCVETEEAIAAKQRGEIQKKDRLWDVFTPY
jgi:hypothetical protein